MTAYELGRAVGELTKSGHVKEAQLGRLLRAIARLFKGAPRARAAPGRIWTTGERRILPTGFRESPDFLRTFLSLPTAGGVRRATGLGLLGGTGVAAGATGLRELQELIGD